MPLVSISTSDCRFVKAVELAPAEQETKRLTQLRQRLWQQLSQLGVHLNGHPTQRPRQPLQQWRRGSGAGLGLQLLFLARPQQLPVLTALGHSELAYACGLELDASTQQLRLTRWLSMRSPSTACKQSALYSFFDIDR